MIIRLTHDVGLNKSIGLNDDGWDDMSRFCAMNRLQCTYTECNSFFEFFYHISTGQTCGGRYVSVDHCNSSHVAAYSANATYTAIASSAAELAAQTRNAYDATAWTYIYESFKALCPVLFYPARRLSVNSVCV